MRNTQSNKLAAYRYLHRIQSLIACSGSWQLKKGYTTAKSCAAKRKKKKSGDN
jgi:hypothetical protein